MNSMRDYELYITSFEEHFPDRKDFSCAMAFTTLTPHITHCIVAETTIHPYNLPANPLTHFAVAYVTYVKLTRHVRWMKKDASRREKHKKAKEPKAPRKKRKHNK